MITGLRTFCMLPVLVPQGLWVASRAVRLPEATGPRAATLGDGRATRVHIIGDSSAAGVGVDTQDNALAGRLATRLAAQHQVSWSLHAKSGWTSRNVLRAIQHMPTAKTDLIVLAVGVNDVKNGVHITKWQNNYTAILDLVITRFNPACIVATGVPPLGAFPLLPSPLRDVLGARAARFDAALAQICGGHDNVTHLPFDTVLDPTHMAADGFHPGPALYDAWAARIVDAVDPEPGTAFTRQAPR